MTTLTLIKPNLPSQLHFSEIPDNVDFLDLANLVNEAKRTGCYPEANTIFANALHYGAADPLVSLLWESPEDRSNYNWVEISKLIYPDLLKLKKNNIEICIPVPLLKPWAQELTFYEVKRLNCCKVKTFVSKIKHNRSIKFSPAGQAGYLLKELAKLVPKYKKIANWYLQPKP